MSKIRILKAIHNLKRQKNAVKKLFTMSKIRILKAIHNYTLDFNNLLLAVYDVKDTNFESNSQLNR